MKFLGIDTSGKRLVVVAQNGTQVAVSNVDCAMQHSVRLMGEIDGVLGQADLTVAACDFIACVVGPGSFTGIRIGIATAKGLCFAAEKPALAVTSLEAIAYADEEENKIALVDAGHGHVYAQGFGAAALQAGFYSVEEVLSLAEGTGAKLLSVEGVANIQTTQVDLSRGLIRAAEALQNRVAPAAELAAVYLRKSNAEEGR